MISDDPKSLQPYLVGEGDKRTEYVCSAPYPGEELERDLKRSNEMISLRRDVKRVCWENRGLGVVLLLLGLLALSLGFSNFLAIEALEAKQAEPTVEEPARSLNERAEKARGVE